MAEYAPILVGDDQPTPDGGFNEPGLIVGSDPLEYQDGDAAYVETYNLGGSGDSTVSFRLPPAVTASPSSRVWISATRRAYDGTAALVVSARPSGESFGGSIAVFPFVAAGDGYETATVEVDFTAIPWGPAAVMSSGTVFYISNATLTGEAATLRTTWLRFIVEGFVPLRQLHRDDGYGMTPPRAFGGASRQRTRRAFGYD